jgi:hypothetical protein
LPSHRDDATRANVRPTGAFARIVNGGSAMSEIKKSPELPDAGKQRGGIGYVLLWFLGVPIPVLILIALLRGCA